MPRRHDIDALRVLAFALLILYHTAMAYVDGWGFHLKSDHTAEWLQWPMLLVNRWRMQLLFLLSGIAIALMRPETRIVRFGVLRSWRLLLPLVFGMVLVVPIQPYCEALTNGHIESGFGAFLLRYWQMPAWPQDSFAGWQLRITWNHLWYLAYLWVYTLVLALLMPVLDNAAVHRAVERFARAPAPLLIGLPSLLSFGWVAWLDPRFPSTNLLFGDWYQHAKYGTVFLAGYLLARATPFWARVVELRRTTLWVAAVAASWYFGIRLLGRVLPDDSVLRQWPDSVWTLQVMASQSLYLWAVLLTLFGWAKVYLDRPFRWLPYCTEAVYPWCILHQSLIIALLFWLKPLHLGPWWEPLLVLAGTVAGCLLLHELLIRRISWLRPLFGLRRPRLPPMRPAAVGAATGSPVKD